MATTMLSFLYQTRTILQVSRAAPRHGACVSRALQLHTSAIRRHPFKVLDDSIPFELPPDLQSDPLFGAPRKPSSDGPKPGKPERLGTITPAEKRAFDDIFREIHDRESREKLAVQSLPPGAFEENASKSERYLVNEIVADAVDVQASPLPEDKPAPLPMSERMRKLRYEALLRYPPSLRKAAEQAMGIPGQPEQVEEASGQAHPRSPRDSKKDPYAGKIQEQVKLERLQNATRVRLEQLMLTAKTDFELIDIVNKEVFSVVKKLGLYEKKDAPAAGKTKRGRPARKAADAPAEVGDMGEKELNLDVHGPLYSKHLVFAVRLFDERFPQSLLVQTLLPRVKALGLTSYILGASSEFYLALMQHMWRRHNDAVGVVDLFEEMAHSGLGFTSAHRRLLHNILGTLRSCAAGEHGPFRLLLMQNPTWLPLLSTRLAHWIGVVASDIERVEGGAAERAAEAEARFRATGSLR